MNYSAFMLRVLPVLVFAGSFLFSMPLSVASDGMDNRSRRVFDPVPKDFKSPRPSGTVVSPSIPPGGIIIPYSEGGRHKPKEPATRPPDYGQQQYGGHGSDDGRTRYRDHSPRTYDYRDSHWPRHRHPPVGAFSFYLSGVPFFYHSGIYYRQYDDEYVIVRAPIGARVRILPDSCSTIYSRGRSYYVCDEDYYEPVDGGYIVVERPVYVDHDPDIDVGDQVRVRVDTLNVRSGPGRHYDIVYQLYRGDIAMVRNTKRGWLFIDLPGGANGWVLREHVRRIR